MATDSTSPPNGSGSSDGGSSNSNDGSNTNGPPSGTSTSSIDGLTTNINQLKDSGKPDLKLSTETRDKYLKIIGNFRADLQELRNKMNGTAALAIGNPGTLESANQTKTNLQLDVTGIGGIHDTVDKYLTYLDAFEATVKKAADRLIKSG